MLSVETSSNFKWWIFFNGTFISMNWILENIETTRILGNISDFVNSCCFFKHSLSSWKTLSCGMFTHSWNEECDMVCKRKTTNPFTPNLIRIAFKKFTISLWKLWSFSGIKSIFVDMQIQMHLWNQTCVYDWKIQFWIIILTHERLRIWFLFGMWIHDSLVGIPLFYNSGYRNNE